MFYQEHILTLGSRSQVNQQTCDSLWIGFLGGRGFQEEPLTWDELGSLERRVEADRHEDTGVGSVALQTVLGGAEMANGRETRTGRRVEDAVMIQGRMTESWPRPHRAGMRGESRGRYDLVLEYVGGGLLDAWSGMWVSLGGLHVIDRVRECDPNAFTVTVIVSSQSFTRLSWRVGQIHFL